MSLKDKAARISLDNLDDDEPEAPVPATAEQGAAVVVDDRAAASPGPAHQRGRSGVAAITHSISMHHRVQDLEAKVSAYEEGGVIQRLDPTTIRESRWKNRHVLSFSTQRYADLKIEIEGAGGNVQPIKVRRLSAVAEDGAQFEIVFGRRRLRACLELGLPVNAIVESMSDVQAFQEMERENRNREDLTPWEQGVMYKDALDQGLFSSLRQLAAAVGLDHSNLSKAMKLASLPAEVLAAFPSPLELQFRWGSDIGDAIDKDPARVMTVAAQIAGEEPRPAAKDVYARLIGGSTISEMPAPREFIVAGRAAAAWTRDHKGNASLKVKAGVLSASKEKKLIEFLEKLFD